MSLEKEMLKIYQNAEKIGGKTVKDTLKGYQRAMNNIMAEIAEISLKYSENGQLKISQAQRLKVLSQLAKQLKAQCQELANAEQNAVSETLRKVMDETYYATAYTIDKGIEVSASFAMLSQEFIDAALGYKVDGKTFSKRIWNNCTALANRVKTDVERAMIQGTSTERLARKIKNDFGSTAYQSKRLINTEVARVVTAAQDQAYRSSGVVSMVMWNATLEGNTCDDCSAHDGMYFALDDHPALPAHPGCRCVLVPVVQGWEPSQRLDNSTPGAAKEVVDYTTVDAWKESRGLK